MVEIRLLKASEIDCRIQQVAKDSSWCSLLLYKDARVDMRLLDEVYGSNNWQRTHEVIGGQLFCSIDIWDEAKKSWVRKQDVGTESNTEAEKGRASDSFRRAGFNIGIGRELYTAPSIFINLTNEDLTKDGKVKSKFAIKSIEYNSDREIKSLSIIDNKGHIRFTYGSIEKPQKTDSKKQDEDTLLVSQEIKEAKTKEDFNSIYKRYPGIQSEKWFLDLLTSRKKDFV